MSAELRTVFHDTIRFQQKPDTLLATIVRTAKLQRKITLKAVLLALPALILLFFAQRDAHAAKVLIIGDTQFAMVAEVAAEIQDSLRSPSKVYATTETKGSINAIAEKEKAQVVVALGMDALSEALRLPPHISIVYGLIIIPPASGRSNMTGVYMSPPVSEYADTIRRYLPALGNIAVLGNRVMIRSLVDTDTTRTSPHKVSSSVELLSALNRLGNARAILLLPDASLLTNQTMANVLLYSFKNNIPLLGVSEANVKQGALFSLVFDHKTVSRQIGEKTQSILNGVAADEIPASPPRKYNLFVNSNTAQRMGIALPGEMLQRSKRVYK